jgi:hypothetical protein
MIKRGIIVQETAKITINEDATCVSVEFPSTCNQTDTPKETLTVRIEIWDSDGTVYESTVTTTSTETKKTCS